MIKGASYYIIFFFFRPEVIIIDLTIPWDGRVDAARSEKLAKFSQLVAAIKENQAFNVTYQSLEIGSFRQRLSDGSESAMKLLYNYITPKMTFDAFRCNLIDLVNYSSYHVSIVSQNTASMAKSDDFDNYDKLEIEGFPQRLQVSPITSVISGKFPSKLNWQVLQKQFYLLRNLLE